jgi:hypothetical protein
VYRPGKRRWQLASVWLSVALAVGLPALFNFVIIIGQVGDPAVKKPEWHLHEALGPREAVSVGLVGLAVVWPLIHHVSTTGYYALGAQPSAVEGHWHVDMHARLLVPYWLVKGLSKRDHHGSILLDSSRRRVLQSWSSRPRSPIRSWRGRCSCCCSLPAGIPTCLVKPVFSRWVEREHSRQ